MPKRNDRGSLVEAHDHIRAAPGKAEVAIVEEPIKVVRNCRKVSEKQTSTRRKASVETRREEKAVIGERGAENMFIIQADRHV